MRPFLPSNLIARTFVVLFALIPVLGLGQTVNITSSGTWQVPCGVTSITITAYGGGGAGGASLTNNNEGSGGEGGCSTSSTVTVGAESLTITLGNGGAGTSANGNAGSATTITGSFGSVVANGGAGGLVGNGSDGALVNSCNGNNGGVGAANSGGNGLGPLGGTGGASGGNSAGGNATNYSAGGGGAEAGNSPPYNGGNGSGGYVVITYTIPPGLNANAGPDQTLAACATSTTLAGNPTVTGQTGIWTVSPSPGIIFSPNNSTPNATVSGLIPGTNYTFTWSFSGLCGSSSDNVIINTLQGPGCNIYCTPSSSSANQLNITNFSFNTISNNSSGTTTYENFTGQSTTVIEGTSYSYSISVTGDEDGFPSPTPDASCVTMYIDWNGDGDFLDASETTVVSASYTGNQTFTGSITPPATSYNNANLLIRIIVNDTGCGNPCVTTGEGQAEDYTVVVVDCIMSTPTINTASGSLGSCVTSVTLDAQAITNGSGSWSLVSGAGNIASPTASNTNVTNLGPGANVFSWTGTPLYSVCPVLTASVTITTVNLPSIANAGPDQGGCASSYTMAATAPTNGNGVWTVSPSGPTITTATSPTTTITGMTAGIYVFTWTVTGTTCGSVSTSDQMTISVASGVTTATAGPDQSGICYSAGPPVILGSTTLSGNTPVVGTGTWTIVGVNGTGGTLNNASSPNATITGINAAGSVTLQWTITGSGCSSSSSDQVTITTANCNGDEPCTALGLSVTSGTCSLSTFNNTGLSVSTGMPEPGCTTINGPDMWFRVTVPASGQVQLNSTTAGAFDEMISIYDGPCNNLQFAGCVNGSGSNVYPLTYAGAPGSVIYVRVNEGGTGDATTGDFQICAYEATTSTVSQVLPGVTTTVTCGQTLNFYDTGGAGGTTSTSTSQPPPAGNYTNNTGTTWKICPSDPTQYVSINFSQFLVENGFDKMIITSGSNNVIAQWTYNAGAGDIVTSQAPGECLTIYFQSDYSYTALGWAAVVSCTNTMQPSQINNECVIQNCTGGCGKWICASGTYGTAAGAGSGVDEINEVTGGCWGASGEVATSWFYFTTLNAGSLEFQFVPSNNGHNINFALYGPTTNGVPPCPSTTGDAPIRCSFAGAGGINTGLAVGETDLYDIATGNGLAAPLTVAAGQTYALAVDVYQNGQPPTQTTINFANALLDCAVLPIELVSFEGINQGRTNLLNWIVASQVNNDYFTIEKSGNGTFWEIVGEVDGAGTTQTPMFYSLVDENPFFPVTYYRLKQTDFDGKFKYSETITITNNKNNENDFIGNLAPNPTSEFATFTFDGYDTQTPLNVTIVNQMGQVVQNLNHVNLHKGMALTIRTNEMSDGLYQVVFTQGNQRQTQKLAVIRK